MIKRILSAVKNILMYGSLDPYGSNWNSDWMESLPESEREKLTKRNKPCQKCQILKGNLATKVSDKITGNVPVVPLGRGTLYMSKMKEEFKEASKIMGFPCIYFIGNTLEPMEYQFISCCPICGEKLNE